jgi:hypothetical protein
MTGQSLKLHLIIYRDFEFILIEIMDYWTESSAYDLAYQLLDSDEIRERNR